MIQKKDAENDEDNTKSKECHSSLRTPPKTTIIHEISKPIGREAQSTDQSQGRLFEVAITVKDRFG